MITNFPARKPCLGMCCVMCFSTSLKQNHRHLRVPEPAILGPDPALPKRFISSHDADVTKRELLAWRRGRNPVFWHRALFATQRCSFVSRAGRFMPHPTCDTKPEVGTMQNYGFVSQVARFALLPVSQTESVKTRDLMARSSGAFAACKRVITLCLPYANKHIHHSKSELSSVSLAHNKFILQTGC